MVDHDVPFLFRALAIAGFPNFLPQECLHYAIIKNRARLKFGNTGEGYVS